MTFIHPENMVWAIVGLALALIHYRSLATQQKKLDHYFSRDVQSRVLFGLSLKPLSRFSAILRTVAVLAFTAALMRPQIPDGLSQMKVRGLELVVALDLSTSMLAEDVKPSRLEFAKSELEKFFDAVAGDKVGLVGFAGSALLISPLTSDATSLKMFLDSMTPYSIETQGTDIAKALAESADAFRRGGIEDDDRARSTRVIVLLSDGEDHEAEALKEARKIVSETGVRVFTVAFGTDRGAPVPLRDERGYLRGYKQDKSGKEILSRVNGAFLEELAAAGQGEFRYATFGESPLLQIKEKIDLLSKEELESQSIVNKREIFQYFLALGLFSSLLELLINLILRRRWLARRSVQRVQALVLAMGLVGSLAGCSTEAERYPDELSFTSFVQTLRGYFSSLQNQGLEAQKFFSEAVIESPKSGLTHFHFGNSQFALKNAADALKELDLAARRSQDSSVLFFIHFNRGFILSTFKGKTEDAIAAYQEALKYKPDSTETKHNIELLVQSGGDGSESKDDPNGEQKDKDGEQPKDQNQDQQQPGEKKQKPKPKPFESQDLSEQDMKRILEELKRQEDSIREKMQREGSRESSKEKDW